MAKDASKTQKKNVKKEENKKQPKKEVVKVKKVEVVENVDTEKVTKEVVKKEKNKDSKESNKKLISAVKTIDNNRKAILFGIVGFLLATLLFRCVLWPDRIATLKDGTQPVVNINGNPYTADDLYTDMKELYSVEFLVDVIDNMILTEKYPEDEDMIKVVNDTVEYYYSAYEKNYQYTKEQTLSTFGFASEQDFVEALTLDYRRNKYYEEYVEKSITDKEINDYYEDEVFGDVDSKHILVKIDKNGLSDQEAKKLAQEIIKKLNSGKTWDEVVKEYKDQIVSEQLGYNAFNASLESSYLKECKNLEVGKYSKTPVLTSYGYHIVYKIAQKEKPSLKEVKDDIIQELVSEKKTDDNQTNKELYYKSLVTMREDAKVELVDTKLAEEYKAYINTYK